MAEESRRRVEQPLLAAGAAFLAGTADDHRSGVGQDAAKVTGNTGRLAMRQSRSVRRQSAGRIAESAADLDQREHIGHADLPQRHRGVRHDGRPRRSGAGRRDVLGLGSTTVDITEPYWKVIRAGAIEEKEIAECLAN